MVPPHVNKALLEKYKELNRSDVDKC